MKKKKNKKTKEVFRLQMNDLKTMNWCAVFKCVHIGTSKLLWF